MGMQQFKADDKIEGRLAPWALAWRLVPLTLPTHATVIATRPAAILAAYPCAAFVASVAAATTLVFYSGNKRGDLFFCWLGGWHRFLLFGVVSENGTESTLTAGVCLSQTNVCEKIF